VYGPCICVSLTPSFAHIGSAAVRQNPRVTIANQLDSLIILSLSFVIIHDVMKAYQVVFSLVAKYFPHSQMHHWH
jgi:hypothetical protein